jgi:hypothetical protein
MEDRAHLAADLFIELGEELLLLGILSGDKMRSDEIVYVGEEGIARFCAAAGGGLVGFVGNLIEDAAGDDGAGCVGFGAGCGDDAAEDFIRRFLEGLRVLEAAAHRAKGGKKIAFFVEAIGVEVFELSEGKAELGTVVTGEGEEEFGAELGGEIVNLVPIDEDGAAAEDRLDNATAGAPGEIAHNENLERRFRFRSGRDPALTRLYIQLYTHIRSFWHLQSHVRLTLSDRCPILHVSRFH